MKCKLYPNIKRLTNLFCVGIACVTLSVLALRLTVFSDMAAVSPKKAFSHIVTSEQGGYTINGKIFFPAADAKGDVFITNLEGNDFVINVDITLADDGKSILTTGFIKPGDSMPSTRMNPAGQKLEDGEYECVAEITAHDPDTLKPVGSAKENIQIYIGDQQASSGKAKESGAD